MQIDKYLEYSGDSVLSIETMNSNEEGTIIHKVITKYGNTLYWDSDSGKVVHALWVVPNTERVDSMDEAALDSISGEYFLRSYGDKFN